MNNDEYLDKFILYLEAIKNYSVHTVLNYRSDLDFFNHYLAEYYSIDYTEVKKDHLRSYVVYLKKEGLKVRSINRKISSIKSFFKYLKRQEVIDHNPTVTLSVLKTPKRLPSYVDSSRIDELLIIEEQQDFHSLRRSLVIQLLYFTGMRRMEIIGVKLEDIDFGKETIKILGKGNKERILPMGNYLKKTIKDYLSFIEDNGLARRDRNLILTDKGVKAYPKLIYNIVNEVLKKYNLSDKHSPHVLRHTFATHLSNNGAELNAIKELLGHASLAATQVYTHNSIERLKKSYQKAHPKS